MAQLPIISGSEISTPMSGTKIDYSSFRDAALAPGRLGAAIGEDVGGVFQDISNKIQSARNAKTVFDTDLAQQATHDQMLHDIATDPNLRDNPQTWLPAYQERIDNLKNQTMAQPMGPLVKQHISQMFDNWALSTKTTMQFKALDREAADFKNSGDAAAAKVFDSGLSDEDKQVKYSGILGGMKDHGAITKAEYDVRMAQFPILDAKQKLNALISSPAAANGEELAKPLLEKLPADDRKDFQWSIHRAQNEVRNQNFDNLLVSFINPETGQVSPNANAAKQITDAIDSGQIDPVRGKNFIAAQQRETEKDDTKFSDSVKARADNIAGWTSAKDSDGGYEEYAANLKADAANIKNPIQQQKVINDIDRQLNSMKNKARLEMSPEASRMYEMMNEDRSQQATFAPLHFGGDDGNKLVHFSGTLADVREMNDRQIEKTFGKGMTKQMVLAQEQGNFDKKWSQMTQWFATEADAGRKPTIEQADAARQQIEYPSVHASVVRSLQKTQDPNAEARQWLLDNPNDPRAAKIKKKLGL